MRTLPARALSRPPPRLAPSSHRSRPSTWACSPAVHATPPVKLTFTLPDGRCASVDAVPGDPLLEAVDAAAAAAGDAGAMSPIVLGCCTGSCGVCEVEVRRSGALDGGLDGAPTVVRACVAAVPAGYAEVHVSLLPDDAVWGLDAWDT